MARFHVKKGDEVVVIAGSARSANVNRGKVISVLTKRQRVVIEGVKMIKRHTKKSQKNPEGKIVEREGTVHISNVVLASIYDARVGAAAPEAGNPATEAKS